MEKNSFLQKNKTAVNLYFGNCTDEDNFYAAISLFKYLKSNNITNPILLSWMDSTKISKDNQRLDYHEESTTNVSMVHFPFFFAIMEINKEKELILFQFVME